MSAVNFLAWIVITAGIFVEAFGILALLTFVHNRIKLKYWEVEDTGRAYAGHYVYRCGCFVIQYCARQRNKI